jgi:hypothetical protein
MNWCWLDESLLLQSCEKFVSFERIELVMRISRGCRLVSILFLCLLDKQVQSDPEQVKSAQDHKFLPFEIGARMGGRKSETPAYRRATVLKRLGTRQNSSDDNIDYEPY